MFREADRRQLEEQGISPEEANRQVCLLCGPRRYIDLDRPCRIGDGIRIPDDIELENGRRQYEDACRQGRLLRFVPASGAASRMFRSLVWMRTECRDISRDSLERQAEAGSRDARECLTFMAGLARFAFLEDLRAVMARSGLDPVELAARGEFGDILEFLLASHGLNCASLPKGLVKFHSYQDGSRTVFEEHLAEAAGYVRDEDGSARLHVTVSPEHRDAFSAVLERIRPAVEQRYDTRFHVALSVQRPATDTLAVDVENRPFRTADGRLLLRPGGHGALIDNLNDLHADVLHIQNVDNMLPEHLRGDAIESKKMLVGQLLAVQQVIHRYLALLTADGASGHEALADALRFASRVLCVELPAALQGADANQQRTVLIEKLNRPVRVCGVVRNTGEPGGGPFWVREPDGTRTLQIVESAQVNPESQQQQAIFSKATYFNPVHLVCGVRDWRGTAYDLARFVDPDAVFIARKSKEGRELKALERPGLWNGAMARWNTVFVEIPIITFTPVKAVNDLLRREHQPER